MPSQKEHIQRPYNTAINNTHILKYSMFLCAHLLCPIFLSLSVVIVLARLLKIAKLFCYICYRKKSAAWKTFKVKRSKRDVCDSRAANVLSYASYNKYRTMTTERERKIGHERWAQRNMLYFKIRVLEEHIQRPYNRAINNTRILKYSMFLFDHLSCPIFLSLSVVIVLYLHACSLAAHWGNINFVYKCSPLFGHGADSGPDSQWSTTESYIWLCKIMQRCRYGKAPQYLVNCCTPVSISGQPHSEWWWCHDIGYPLLAAVHPCRMTSMHSRTMSPLDSAWKPGAEHASCMLSTL